jgi:HEAT repeat protein
MSDRSRWRDLAIAGHSDDAATARAGLADPDPVARELALGALERLAQLSDDELQTALADPHPSVRRRAITIAALRPDLSLLSMLDDPDPMVVEVAAWACGEQVDVATVERLVQLATDADEPLVREAAVASLGAIGDERGLPAILAACTDKPAVRRRAVLALAPFSGPEVDAALTAALSDRDWQVRQSAEDIAPQHPT